MPQASIEDQFNFLMSCVRHSDNGKVDFAKVAEECGIVSKGAAGKRYERMMKANNIALNESKNNTPTKDKIGGNGIGTGNKSSTPTPTPKGKKRKVVEENFRYGNPQDDDLDQISSIVKSEKNVFRLPPVFDGAGDVKAEGFGLGYTYGGFPGDNALAAGIDAQTGGMDAGIIDAVGTVNNKNFDMHREANLDFEPRTTTATGGHDGAEVFNEFIDLDGLAEVPNVPTTAELEAFAAMTGMGAGGGLGGHSFTEDDGMTVVKEELRNASI